MRLRVGHKSAMADIKLMLPIVLFLPYVISNCLQDFQEDTNRSMSYAHMAIPNFFEFGESCGSLRRGLTDDCSNKCKDNIVRMNETYPWLFECDCQHGIKSIYSANDCFADRRRLPICFEPENSCSRMYNFCNDSSTCRAKLNNYMNDCKIELNLYKSKVGCDTACMYSYKELLYDTDAASLWECACDKQSIDWCSSFINRTECSMEYTYDSEYYSSDTNIASEIRPSVENKPQLSSCLKEMRIFCDAGDLNCQHTIGGDLLQLVECDQMDEIYYNCSGVCGMMILQMKEKYPFLYTCNCEESLPMYHPDTCDRDKIRYENCTNIYDLNPKCSSLYSCFDEPANCSNSLLSSFLTNCSSNMFSKEPEDMLCTEECKTAVERLSNSTEGSLLKQCPCDKHFELCIRFQEELCTVLMMPSTSNRLSSHVFITCFTIFVLVFKKIFQE